MLRVNDGELALPWHDKARERFDADNAELILQTRALLGRVIPDTALHARLINTLSMLEHMGTQKIMVTQHAAGIDQPTLKHIAEEAHHAYFMKRQAEKAAGRPLEYVPEDLLAPASARMYFRRLEASMLGTLHRQRSARAAYLYMSMIVEFRALWFYGLYQQALRKARHPLSLKRVLGEEAHHLQDMAHRLELGGELSNARVDAFLSCEKTLYTRLLGAMRTHVVKLRPADPLE
jgi:hypothetical protein